MTDIADELVTDEMIEAGSRSTYVPVTENIVRHLDKGIVHTVLRAAAPLIAARLIEIMMEEWNCPNDLLMTTKLRAFAREHGIKEGGK